MCQARAYFHMSIEMRLSKTQHGIEIGRLHQTISTLNEVLKFCQSTQVLKEAADLVTAGGGNNNSRLRHRRCNDNEKIIISPMAEAAATIQPEAEGLLRLASDRLKTAEEDNRSVYLEDVPKPNESPEIRPQTMVKTDLPLPDAMLKPRVNLFSWDG